MSEALTLNQFLDQYGEDALDLWLFDQSESVSGKFLSGILAFAELEIAVRSRLYDPDTHLERMEQPIKTRIQRALEAGMVALAKSALQNGFPTDTVFFGNDDRMLYRKCVERLQTTPDRWLTQGRLPETESSA